MKFPELGLVYIAIGIISLTTVITTVSAGCTGAVCPLLPAPPANVTFFPHDNDCTRYCMCDWFGTVHDMPCPDGLHWNTVLDTCDWPWAAGCDSSSTPPTPDTTTSTTTSTTTTTTTTPSPSTGDPGCANADCPFFPEPPANVTFFPHDDDCTRYCMCDWFSYAHDMACPDGLHWNAVLDTCDWPWAAGCDPSATPPTPDTTTSTTTSTTTTTTTTPSPSTGDPGCANADCPFFPEPPANVTFFPHDDDCTRYCMCDWFSYAHDMACPDGLHWNAVLDTCDWPWAAGCDPSATPPTPDTTTSTTTSTTTTTTTTPSPSTGDPGCANADCPFFPEPPANVTFFPHDDDCTRYCMCDWFSYAHDMACPDGLHWNAVLDTCDWPWDAGCDPSATPSTPDTTTSTTTSTTTTTTTTTTPAPSNGDPGCSNSVCPFFPAPPANVTFFPHDDDCTRYCMCDWFSYAHDMPCPDGLHWNAVLDTCDWPWDAGCA